MNIYELIMWELYDTKDELLWAATWLYKAGGDDKYLSYVSANQGWSQPVSEFSWDNKFVGAQTLLTKVRSYVLRISLH